MMLEHFGEEYRAYIQSTGRLLPLIGFGAYRGVWGATVRNLTVSLT